MAMQVSAAKARIYLKTGVRVTRPFTHFSSLERWGWVQEEVAGEPLYKNALNGIFSGLGISTGHNKYIGWLQAEEVDNDEGEEVEVSLPISI